MLIAPVPAAGDEVAAWLERNGLMQLLAVHLEEQLEQAPTNERGELVVRLAGIYARLLGTVDDEARRADLQQRSRRLLEQAPSRDTSRLELALLRTSYRTAEQSAERHRLRQGTDEELQRARASLDELIEQFDDLRERLEDDARLLERRLGRASGSDAVMIGEEAEEARQLYSQCTFLSAWSIYYQAWLNNRPDIARTAQRRFAELLDLEGGPPDPRDVSVDLRSEESIARCILGMALCKSLTASSVEALQWLALLEHERTYPPLREELPAWMMAIHLEHDEYADARAILDRLTKERSVPLHWLRLAVVHALEAEFRSGRAAELARFAVTELAARGELEQVFDLAQRYGAEALGAHGFAQYYVRGVLTYYRARERHGGDEPTSDEAVAALYDEAMTAFRAARQEPDAKSFPSALPDCQRLAAWCLYFQGRLVEAQRAFEAAADLLAPEEAPEALWMAIVCLDRLLEAQPDNTRLADRLAALVDRFLAEYPSDPHAPKLILRRALTSEEISAEVAEQLLSIPPQSEVYDAARRRAAQVLYQLFREAERVQRIAWGEKYLSVALPLFEREHERLSLTEPLAVARHLVTGRRILEIAFQEGIERVVVARTVLESIEELRRRPSIELEDLESELAYRRLQERLITGDPEAASLIADRMREEAPESVWSRLASRAMFRYGNDRWKEAEELGLDDRAAVALVVRYGRHVLEEYDNDPRNVSDPGVMATFAAVADAAMTIWKRSGDRQRGELALTLFEGLREARPRNAGFLHATALLSEAFDRDEQALECWRALVAGSPQGTNAWYEAKFHLLNLLAARDPSRARAVMDQHKQLNPEYGPDPWGPRLRALDLRIATSPDTEASAGSAEEAQGTGAGEAPP
ncbi:MAG: hypothetical protein SYC29_03835 [Planctomycetota bacterium]|nr:hypothetical protein [Planctomycetota bacterium]